MQWSEQRDQIAPALVRAQSKIAGAEKRSKIQACAMTTQI